MSITLQRKPGAEFAQLVAVAEKCPVHKLMTTVTTEITSVVERAAQVRYAVNVPGWQQRST